MKTILVTGATDGIGRATALELARRGARVVVHGRNGDKVRAVVSEVAAAAADGAGPVGVIGDLASFTAVRQLAAEITGQVPALDVLINNAGVFATERTLTDDGHELTFAVNHLATFLLTSLLLPSLRAAAPSRVVTVSSVAHTRGTMHWDDLDLERSWDGPHPGPQSPGYGAYAQSKLANVLFANALARRVAGDRITSNSLHPGVISTKLLQTGFGMSGASTASGAATSVHVALAPELAGVTGRYFSNSREASAAPAALDTEAQERLWSISAELTGLDEIR